MAPSTELTPQERLAISRKAIVRHMNRHNRALLEDTADEGADEAGEPGAPLHESTLDRLSHAARIWWHRHPASAALELATPLLHKYSRAHPFKLVAISAAVGAAVVVVRPWRMISASALVVAAVKSSGLSNTLATMVSSFTRRTDTGDTRP